MKEQSLQLKSSVQVDAFTCAKLLLSGLKQWKGLVRDLLPHHALVNINISGVP